MADFPNLLFFLSENHARHVAGCYGHRIAQTPNLDRLAALGATFENAYCASPICCPARASIATGLYPHQSSYWENSTAYNGRVPTWMHHLRDAGHEVTAIGKLHFRRTADDNGFTEEIEPMHIVGGIGGLLGLLRGSGEEPVRAGNWEMYVTDLGAGETAYQEYDRRITRHAIEWLNRHRAHTGKPWILCVNHISAHPPFKVPQRLLDLYPLDRVPLPVAAHPGVRPEHPAIRHLRRILGQHDELDETTLKRIAAAYFALVTHLDEQVGKVLAAAEDAGLLGTTRVIYSSDHGDCFGNHYILGKFNLYERAVGVPLIMAGPGIPARKRVSSPVSHVDLLPTILEAFGQEAEDFSRMSGSLWRVLRGRTAAQTAFAEYHGLGSLNASYMLREGASKLVYHVGMPAQLFDLEQDPDELQDRAADPAYRALRERLEGRLRGILDPEATDARAKAEQRSKAAEFGGTAAILARGGFPYTPPPGTAATFLPVTEADIVDGKRS
jgi:choline-sulfatase